MHPLSVIRTAQERMHLVLVAELALDDHAAAPEYRSAEVGRVDSERGILLAEYTDVKAGYCRMTLELGDYRVTHCLHIRVCLDAQRRPGPDVDPPELHLMAHQLPGPLYQRGEPALVLDALVELAEKAFLLRN